MSVKTKKTKQNQGIAEGITINEFLKDSFLKELGKSLGKGYYLVSNHLDLVVLKENKKNKKILEVSGHIHLAHPKPKDYSDRKIFISSKNKKFLKKILNRK
ncbi:MAG: hypothetical protein UX17_C0076G0002 [Parcubacteria group bacterium GW2011_GWC2_45_7]|nr:MAG: hypothetical protein UX17_C0076G0002 [Parcubacteria group bacterium GW2011_GWC2_45_7]